MPNEHAEKRTGKTKRSSSRAIKNFRDRTLESLDEMHEDINALQDEALESILETGIPEQDVPEIAECPPLVPGRRYRIRDDNANGIFVLDSVVDGKCTLFVFANVVTGAKTTYTAHSLKDLSRTRGWSITMTEEKEEKKFLGDYFSECVIGTLRSKKEERHEPKREAE